MGKYSANKLPSDVLNDIARKVKILRKSKGWSQLVMAERSGVSFGSVKRFETTGQISFESLLLLSHVLGKLSDFDFILNDEESDNIENLFTK